MNSIKFLGAQVDAIIGYGGDLLRKEPDDRAPSGSNYPETKPESGSPEGSGAIDSDSDESGDDKHGANFEIAEPAAADANSKVTFWTITMHLLLLRWSEIAHLLASPDVEQVDEVPALRPQVLTGKRMPRASRKSVSMLRRPLSLKDHERKTLVLDLDETLIHSMARGSRLPMSQLVEVHQPNGLSSVYYVAKRPYCDLFLAQVSQWYDLVVFTASVKSYADPMIDLLEQSGITFSKRFYRDDCVKTPMGYIKDLCIVGDLSRVVLVDNSPISYALQRNNGIAIEGWISDPSDECLLYLLPLLGALRYVTDVRSFLCLKWGEHFQQDPSLDLAELKTDGPASAGNGPGEPLDFAMRQPLPQLLKQIPSQ